MEEVMRRASTPYTLCYCLASGASMLMGPIVVNPAVDGRYMVRSVDCMRHLFVANHLHGLQPNWSRQQEVRWG